MFNDKAGVSLGGKSYAKRDRDKFLKQQRADRENRAEQRLREDSAKSIQRVFRKFSVVEHLRREMREQFDKRYADVKMMASALQKKCEQMFWLFCEMPENSLRSYEN